MNEGNLIREIWRENRKLVAILSAVTVGLIVVFVTVIIIKNVTDTTNEIQNVEVETVSEVEEAPESDLDIELYIDELHDTIYHVCRYKMDDCVIGKGKLLEDGTWYVTTIKQLMANQWGFPEDTYRVVVRKLAGVWEIVAGPSLIFSYDDYPNIPKEILKSANELI